jgi:hypothetical protein
LSRVTGFRRGAEDAAPSIRLLRIPIAELPDALADTPGSRVVVLCLHAAEPPDHRLGGIEQRTGQPRIAETEVEEVR